MMHKKHRRHSIRGKKNNPTRNTIFLHLDVVALEIAAEDVDEALAL